MNWIIITDRILTKTTITHAKHIIQIDHHTKTRNPSFKNTEFITLFVVRDEKHPLWLLMIQIIKHIIVVEENINTWWWGSPLRNDVNLIFLSLCKYRCVYGRNYRDGGANAICRPTIVRECVDNTRKTSRRDSIEANYIVAVVARRVRWELSRIICIICSHILLQSSNKVYFIITYDNYNTCSWIWRFDSFHSRKVGALFIMLYNFVIMLSCQQWISYFRIAKYALSEIQMLWKVLKNTKNISVWQKCFHGNIILAR